MRGVSILLLEPNPPSRAQTRLQVSFKQPQPKDEPLLSRMSSQRRGVSLLACTKGKRERSLERQDYREREIFQKERLPNLSTFQYMRYSLYIQKYMSSRSKYLIIGQLELVQNSWREKICKIYMFGTLVADQPLQQPTTHFSGRLSTCGGWPATKNLLPSPTSNGHNSFIQTHFQVILVSKLKPRK